MLIKGQPTYMAFACVLHLQLKDGRNVLSNTRYIDVHGTELGKQLGAYRFINCGVGSEEREELGTSLFNAFEAEAAYQLVVDLIKEYGDAYRGYRLDIGVISPYKGQVRTGRSTNTLHHRLTGHSPKSPSAVHHQVPSPAAEMGYQLIAANTPWH